MLNVVVTMTPPAVTTTMVCAPLASYDTVVTVVTPPLTCVCVSVRAGPLYTFVIVR